MPPLVLSDDEVQQLQALASSRSLPHSIVQRAQIVLACGAGETNTAIAHILGNLEDKIELDRRMNETLEAKARAIFKSWFVDFDPARAKAEERDPGLPQEIADLFPDSFEDSELVEIPRGWEVAGLEGVDRDCSGVVAVAGDADACPASSFMKPLWWTMEKAYGDKADDCLDEGPCFAAEHRVIADAIDGHPAIESRAEVAAWLRQESQRAEVWG